MLAVVTAGMAAGALLLQRKNVESLKKTIPAVFALSLVAVAAMAKTAHEGGKIRHPEINDVGAGASMGISENKLSDD